MKTQMTFVEWKTQGMKLFGHDMMKWPFRCPICGHVATGEDYQKAEAPEGTTGFSCIGRWTGATEFKEKGKGPCNYAGGGLFKMNPIVVTFDDGSTTEVFEFAAPQK